MGQQAKLCGWYLLSAPLLEVWRGSVSIATITHTQRGRQTGPWGHLIIGILWGMWPQSCKREEEKALLSAEIWYGQACLPPTLRICAVKKQKEVPILRLHMGAFPSHQSADICKLSIKGDDDASHKELVRPAGGLGDRTPRRQWVDAHSALPFTQGGTQAPPKEGEIFF